MLLQGDEGPLGPPGSVGSTVRTSIHHLNIYKHTFIAVETYIYMVDVL